MKPRAGARPAPPSTPTQAAPAREKWLYGKAVLNGGTSNAVVRFLSVSRLSGADPEEDGCLRKWYYEMVLGRKQPSSRAKDRGDRLHKEIEHYLLTGENALSSLAMSGFHMIPKPGPDLLVEHDLLRRPGDPAPTNEAEAAVLLARAPLTAAGIPVLGRMDLIHGRGENKGATDVTEAIDPEGTVEVLDWKSTGRPDYIKPARRLPRLIQMAGYGEWAYRVEPDTKLTRLSHGYFVESGGPSRKVSIRVPRETIAPTWEHAEDIARQIIHAARASSPDHVDANTRACKSYGGCFHRDVCKAGMHSALAGFIGRTAADRLLNKSSPDVPASATSPATTGDLIPMSTLLSRLKKPAAPAATTAPTEDTAAAKAAEIARLQAEEAALRERKLFTDLMSRIAAYGMGTPALRGDLVKVYATINGIAAAPDVVDGTGEIGAVGVETIATLQSLADELAQAVAAGTIQPPDAQPAANSLLAPETPEPDAPAPPNAPPLSEITREIPRVAAPPVAPPAPTLKTAKAAAAAAKKAADIIQAADESFSAIAAAALDKVDADECTDAPAPAISVYVDVSVENLGTVSLLPWVDKVTAELCREIGAADVRLASAESGASHGKWRGMCAAAGREYPLEPGTYYIETHGSEIVEAILEGLRTRARLTGGAFVRGRR